jgi:hypothetical protein
MLLLLLLLLLWPLSLLIFQRLQPHAHPLWPFLRPPFLLSLQQRQQRLQLPRLPCPRQ